MDLIPSVIVILLLMFTFILDNYRKYNYIKKKDEKLNNKYKEYQKFILNITIIVVIIGFLSYLIQKI